MPTPFPGMDPYLEAPALWPSVHSRLIVAIADALAPKIQPKYYVSIEERAVLPAGENLRFSMRPDVAATRTTLHEVVVEYSPHPAAHTWLKVRCPMTTPTPTWRCVQRGRAVSSR